MTLPVFRIDPAEMAHAPGEILTLTGDEGRHAAAVKRLRPGEQLMIGDGRGTLAVCTVTETQGKDVLLAEIDGIKEVSKQKPSVTIVQAIPKGERGELAVDLSTQAGVDRIIPWQSERCIVQWNGAKAQKGVAKWQRTAVEAAKQSRRAWDPEVLPLTNLDDICQLISETHEANGVTAILHESTRVKFNTLPFARSSAIILVIGPEGGLTRDEIDALESAGGHAVVMGPTVVRSAAAGAVALGALGVLTERW